MLLAINKYPQLQDFFLKGQSWIFFCIILFVSLICVSEGNIISGGAYLSVVAGFSLVYAPTLWFVTMRDKLRDSLNKWGYRALWLALFAGYPLLLTGLELAINDFLISGPIFEEDSSNNRETISIMGAFLFAMATLLHVVLENPWMPNFKRFFGRLSVPKIIGLFAIIASMLGVAGSDGFQESTTGLSEPLAVGLFFTGVFQTLLVYAPYLLLFYVHYEFVYRRLLAKRGLLFYGLGMGALVLLFTPVHSFYALLFPAVRHWWVHPAGFHMSVIGEASYAVNVGFTALSIPIILFLEWVRKTKTIALLEKEKTDTELSLLKQQVNPHFFFNTLNNLYSLSLKQDPATPETVLQLSELMRYVIYRAKEERVELQEEVKYLEDYLDLQRIRLYQEADIDFVIDVENPELEVPPLLFIILVENAFKHGIEPAVEDCFLQIELIERGGEITFICHNSREEREEDDHQKPGIGLENMTRRLELLYPDLHELSIRETAVDYRVELTLWEAMPLTAPAPEEDVYEVRYDLDEQLL